MKITATIKLLRLFSWVWFLPLCIAIFKLWLTSHLPILAYYAPHDQLRYVQMASEISNFSPPFDYNHYVLMRQPGYAASIFLSYSLGFSLRFFQELLYIITGFLLAWSIYSYYPKKNLVRLFLILYILAPISYFINRQTLQECLYLPLTSVIISCLIHLINLYSDPKKFIGWSIILGVALAWFWNTRPENVWILPSMGLAYITIITKAIKGNLTLKTALYRTAYSIICLIIPVFLLTISLKFATYAKYGIFQTNDLTAPGIKAAYSRILSVSPERWEYMVAVPEETRKEIYSVSPTFQKLSGYLENAGKNWFSFACNSYLRLCDDYSAGWFIWALRDAVAEVGEYKSATSTENFYAKIAEEIKSACDAKTIKCNNLNFSLPSVNVKIRSEYIKPFFNSIVKLSRRLIVKTSEINLTAGNASTEIREAYYTRITREPVNFLEQRDRSMNKFKDNLIILISEIYKFCFPPLLGLGVVGIVLQHISNLKKSKQIINVELTIIWLMLLSVLTRLLIFAWIDATSYPILGGMRYLWPIFPLVLMLIAIGVSNFMTKFSLVFLKFIPATNKE